VKRLACELLIYIKDSKNAYMWEPIEFFDDLEHSIFKIMLTCGT
jgi:hypothetical protein